jgi:hypothetical protein
MPKKRGQKKGPVIHEALSGTTLEVRSTLRMGLFSDIDCFVKLSQGNIRIVVDFYPGTRKETIRCGK